MVVRAADSPDGASRCSSTIGGIEAAAPARATRALRIGAGAAAAPARAAPAMGDPSRVAVVIPDSSNDQVVIASRGLK